MGFFQDIKDRLTGRYVLHTTHGDFNLARKSDRQKFRKMVVEIQRTTDSLTRQDLGDWRRAWQMAINVDNPNRLRLYQVYRDVEIDAHLSGCVEQRKGFVLSRSFKLVADNGEEDEDALAYFDQAWFKQLMRFALNSIYWGHSLIELGDVVSTENGLLTLDGVTLIDRRHVIPEYHRVVKNLGDDWHSGFDYHEAPFANQVIEAGQPHDLGLYLKAAQQTIPKKNAMGFWDTFTEIFGMPMRIAKTTSRDEKDISRLQKVLDLMGSTQSGVMPEGTEIEIVESSKGDAFNVYDRRIDRANSELSKLIIGQTMTIEDGSSLSQSETHLKVFENLVEADCDIHRELRRIRSLGLRNAIAFNPETPVERVVPYLDEVDEVLVMTVHPGYGGQAFIDDCLPKIAAIHAMRPALDIMVDGGINAETAVRAAKAGANMFVAGSYLFRQTDMRAAVAAMRRGLAA